LRAIELKIVVFIRINHSSDFTLIYYNLCFLRRRNEEKKAMEDNNDLEKNRGNFDSKEWRGAVTHISKVKFIIKQNC
jgi:hypothetical protein